MPSHTRTTTTPTHTTNYTPHTHTTPHTPRTHTAHTVHMAHTPRSLFRTPQHSPHHHAEHPEHIITQPYHTTQQTDRHGKVNALAIKTLWRQEVVRSRSITVRSKSSKLNKADQGTSLDNQIASVASGMWYCGAGRADDGRLGD